MTVLLSSTYVLQRRTMGEAKRNREAREQTRERRREILTTLHWRLLKAALGFVLCIPVLIIFFTVKVGFQDNKFPWEME